MNEFPDRFRVIDAGEGAKGVDQAIVQLAPNVRSNSLNGLNKNKDHIIVQVIYTPRHKFYCEPGQIWRISKYATYEKI